MRCGGLCCRYLYYTDWGKTASVVRTRLDGSSPTVIKTGLNNPGSVAVVGSTVYVTESHYRTRIPPNARTSINGSLYSMNSDGSGWTDVLAAATTKLKVSRIRITVCSGLKWFTNFNEPLQTVV